MIKQKIYFFHHGRNAINVPT